MTAWKLIIEDDAGKTIVVPLARDEITIGRKEGNTIRLTERNVSRFHARLTRQSSHVFIQDCESYTGVRINGDRIRGQVEVREGDLIEIGDYHLALQAEGARPALAGAQSPVTTQPATPVSAASADAFGDEGGEDDQFAGDTQRWEPSEMDDSPLLGALPTEEGSALLPETETQRYTAPLVDDPTREETARIDSTDPTFPSGVAPAPISALGDAMNPFSLDDETQRTSSVPGGLPLGNEALEPATLPGGQAPSAPGVMLADAPDEQDTIATSIASPTMADSDEQTEAVHVAPGIEEVLLERARLVALNTVFAGTVLPFDQDAMVIGRTEDNDLVIQHKSVSRNHARIVREGDGWRMQDLGSANGILVNNEEVGSALLSSGDVVELGRVRLRFVEPGEHFELSADEVARARVADAAGEEWDDAATHITAASRDGLVGAKKKPPLVAIAIGAGALLLIVVAVFLLTGGGGDEPAPADPVTATAAVEVDARAAAVAAERVAEAKQHLGDGKPDLARLAAQDAVDSGGGAEAEAVLAEAVAAQKAASSILVARNQLEEGRYEDALVSAQALEGSGEADEARQIATTAKRRLVEEYVEKARAAHDEDRRADRHKALAALRRHDAARADQLESAFIEEDGATATAADDESERVRKSGPARKPAPKRPPPKRVQTREQQRPEEPKMSPEEIAAEVDALERQATQALFAGNAAGAAKHLEEARKLSPRRATLYRGLGQAYEKLGRQKKAAWAYETYLKYSPGAPDRDLVKKKIQELGGS